MAVEVQAHAFLKKSSFPYTRLLLIWKFLQPLPIDESGQLLEHEKDISAGRHETEDG